MAGPRRLGAGDRCRAKGMVVGDQVIRGENEHEALGIRHGDQLRRRADRRRRVARLRLDDDPPVGAAGSLRLLGHDEAEVMVRQQYRLGELLAHHARKRAFKERSAGKQVRELLRVRPPRGRPEPRSRTTAHDHRLTRHGGAMGGRAPGLFHCGKTLISGRIGRERPSGRLPIESLCSAVSKRVDVGRRQVCSPRSGKFGERHDRSTAMFAVSIGSRDAGIGVDGGRLGDVVRRPRSSRSWSSRRVTAKATACSSAKQDARAAVETLFNGANSCARRLWSSRSRPAPFACRSAGRDGASARATASARPS